jgi:prophage antirepressor-like protein
MNTNIISNDFNGQSIRIIFLNDEPWFVAKDVFAVLGKTSKSGNDFDGLDEDELSVFKIHSGDQNRNLKIVSESGLYFLVLKSRKPIAKPFQKWVTREVLPSIRKTGSYSLEKSEISKLDSSKSLEIVENGTQLLTKLRELNPVEQMKLENFHKKESGESLLEKFGIDFKNSYFLPTELGKFSGQSGAEINLILEKKGFQEKIEGVWIATEKGENFCLKLGGKFNQLKWRIETIL